MSTIVDNTGSEKLVSVAGLVWVETKYSSYTARRSGRFYVGETPKRFFRLYVDHRDVGIAFGTARDAQNHAATLSEVAA